MKTTFLSDTKTLTGTIKFYLCCEGYGFIVQDGEDDPVKDRFFHWSQLSVERVKGNKFKTISQGTKVSFVPIETDRGPAAMHVTPISATNSHETLPSQSP